MPRRALNATAALFLLAASAAAAASPAAGQVPALSDERGYPTLSPLVEQVTPAVVNVSVTSSTTVTTSPLFNDPFFREFFNIPELPDIPQTRRTVSAGSGVIVDADEGYVLSNHHVVDGAEEIVVTLKDRRRFTAELIGSDPGTDIALLRIDADNLTELPLGDSDLLEIGDYVIAVGNPFGIGQTVTSGLVSALGRSGINPEGYEDFIQTDAPINPGNSGGALIALDGRLVGINTAIIAPARGNVGIGFAVPSNMARAVMDQLIAHGEVRRGRLGVLIQDLTPDLADAMGVETTLGAVVSSVEDGSPADRAGLEAGDVIVELDGEPVESSAQLRASIGLTPAGERVRLTVLRDGRERRITATLEPASVTGGAVQSEASAPKLSGARFRDLARGDPQYGEIEGVVVTEVAPGSAAERAGLRAGDVITAVNQQRVTTVGELEAALEEAGGGTLAISLVRGRVRMFIAVR